MDSEVGRDRVPTCSASILNPLACPRGYPCDHLESFHDRDGNTEGQRGEETPQGHRASIPLPSAPLDSVKE